MGWHHFSVLLFVWASHLTTKSNMHIVFTWMNMVVHTLMYGYYAARAIGIRPPYPVVLTGLQIVQMVIGTATVWYSQYCPEDYRMFWFGIVMYSSYLFLFSKMFVERYLLGGGKKDAKAKKKRS